MFIGIITKFLFLMFVYCLQFKFDDDVGRNIAFNYLWFFLIVLLEYM